MARPRKTGLNYYPADTNRRNDFKIMDLLNEYGPLGYTIYDICLQYIYESGYFLDASLEQVKLSLIKDIGSKWIKNKDLVGQIIDYCADIGLFEKNLLQQNVITSVGVQRRYDSVTVRNKVDKSKYWLIEKDNLQEADISVPNNNVSVTETQVNVTEIPVNATKMQQRKVKESKENKSNIYSSILDEFNRICSTLPKPQSVNENRRKAIKRTEELLNNNSLSFTDLFTKVNASDFLSGRDGKWTGCNFDWILKPSNLTKIIEGNYDNKTLKPNRQVKQSRMEQEPSYDIEELERRRFYDA